MVSLLECVQALFKHSFSLQKNRGVFIQDNRADIIHGTGSGLSLCIEDKGKWTPPCGVTSARVELCYFKSWPAIRFKGWLIGEYALFALQDANTGVSTGFLIKSTLEVGKLPPFLKQFAMYGKCCLSQFGDLRNLPQVIFFVVVVGSNNVSAKA